MRWLGSLLICAGCAGTQTAGNEVPAAGKDLATFLARVVEELEPLRRDEALSWYEASVTGSDEAFARSRRAADALNAFLADPQRFAEVESFRTEPVEDPLLRRQLEVLYLELVGKQVPPELLAEITALEKDLEQAFNTYRGQLKGEPVSQNDILEIMRTSTDGTELRAAWEAQKGVGALVAPKLKALVELRNRVAKQLGFRDFYALRIAESEQNEEELIALFDELDRTTREPFLARKAEVDRRLAERLGIEINALMPWHYQNPFFQEPPDVFATGLDAAYEKQDTLGLCRSFFEGIGLDVARIIEHSDLYEKSGKTPHAFSANIDRRGDIRVIANIVPGLEWQTTMVHELGHAVYDEYIAPDLPWLLRTQSHALTTEGIAMMLDRLVPNPIWAEAMGVIDSGTRTETLREAQTYLAFASLQFSRWAQVMLRFERELYRDPAQDLDRLWWDLVEEYQGLTRPERQAPDYASKIHLVIVPVYYHNYMMGELFASQVHESLAKQSGVAPFAAVYVGDPRVGDFLKKNVFAPGALHPWHELTERVTGSPLSAAAFARRFHPAGE